jgi:hypothetical protein
VTLGACRRAIFAAAVTSLTSMHTIAIKLQAKRLANPDLDIRYELPDLLAARSGGVISSDGYDYVGGSNDLVLFLLTSDLQPAIACIHDVIASVPILENDLREVAVVAIEREGRYEVIYPENSEETFTV